MDAEGFGATLADVEEIIRRDYPAEQFSEVRRLLNRLDSPRIQVAVLMVAGGDWQRLEHGIEVAEKDERDLLYWAFYPDA